MEDGVKSIWWNNISQEKWKTPVILQFRFEWVKASVMRFYDDDDDNEIWVFDLDML